MDLDLDQENRWVEGLRQGDEGALEEVMRHYQYRLLGLVRRYIRNQETALDVLQDVFLNLFKNMRNLNEDTRLFPLLARMASNRSIDYIRKAKHTKNQVSITDLEEINRDPPVSGNQFKELVKGEQAEMLKHAIEQLPPRQKEIFFLRHYEGMKLEEIAQTLGVALGTVKATLSQAVKNLRETVSKGSRS